MQPRLATASPGGTCKKQSVVTSVVEPMQLYHPSQCNSHRLTASAKQYNARLKAGVGPTSMVGSALGASLAHTVSPMPTSERPVKAQMSPASTRSAGTLLKLSYTNSSAILPVLVLTESAGPQIKHQLSGGDPGFAGCLVLPLHCMTWLAACHMLHTTESCRCRPTLSTYSSTCTGTPADVFLTGYLTVQLA